MKLYPVNKKKSHNVEIMTIISPLPYGYNARQTFFSSCSFNMGHTKNFGWKLIEWIFTSQLPNDDAKANS